MSIFAIPESVFVYYNDKAVMAAVDHFIEEKKESLSGVDDWPDLPAYYRARLSAYQCQAEHALMLHDLWNAIWQPAIDAEPRLSRAERIDVGTYPIEYNHALTVEHIWEDGGFGSAFRLPSGGRIDLNVYLTSDGVQIGFIMWDAADEICTDTLAVHDLFPDDAKEDIYRFTQPRTVLLKSREIDISFLETAAARVVSAFADQGM